MKKVFSILSEHLREDFNLKYYTTFIFFIGSIIFLNSYFGIEKWIQGYYNNPLKILLYFGFYVCVMGIAVLITISFHRLEKKKLYGFIVGALFAIGVFSLSNGMPYISYLIQMLSVPYEYFNWVRGVVNELKGMVIVTLPLLIYARGNKLMRDECLGLTNVSLLKPYFIMLAIVFPFVVLASFEYSFFNYYPIFSYKIPPTEPIWPWVLGFEFFYGIDFITTELLFRGFLVVALSKYIGRHSILPMVAFYVTIHFGKPMGEVISSTFGGFLLGILAYRTRSVWGGVIAHLGLAYMMEFMGWIQHLVRGG